MNVKNIIYPSELRTNLDCAIWWKQLCIFARIHWLTKYSLSAVINWRELTEIDSLFHDFFQNFIAFEKCGQNCPNVMSGNVPNGSHLMTSIICKSFFFNRIICKSYIRFVNFFFSNRYSVFETSMKNTLELSNRRNQV